MIFDKLLSKRSATELRSSLANPDDWLFAAFGAVPSATGVAVNEKTAIQIVAYWSAVSTISDTLASLPLKLVRSLKDGNTETINIHPALRVLRNPNEMMVPITFRSTLQSQTLTHGNSYAYIVRNKLGQAVELWPLDPALTRPVVIKRRLFFDTTLDIGATRIPGADVLHVPSLTRNGIEGLSIIREQREMLGSAIAQQNFAAKFFNNGAKPSGLLAYPGKIRDTEKIKKALEDSTGGENAHSMMVLDQDAKFTPFSVPPEDAQFLQTREFSVDEIGRMFRLPLHFLNKMGQATFNNLEMMGTHFVQYTMMPWIIRHEQEYTRKLLKPGEIDRGLRFKFNVSALIRGDIKTRAEVYAKAIQFGWLTRNEVRALEDTNPLDGLDDPLIPMNLKVVGEEPEPEPEPAPEDDPEDDPDDDSETDSTEPGDEDRGYLVLMAAATRLANKESMAVKRKMHQTDCEAALTEFYEGHAQLMVENLAIDIDSARQYCRDRIESLHDGVNLDEYLLRMTSTDVANLVNAIIEDRK